MPQRVPVEDIPRNPRGHATGDFIVASLAARLGMAGVPEWTGLKGRYRYGEQWSDAFLASLPDVLPDLPFGLKISIIDGNLGRCGGAAQRTVAEAIGYTADDLWPLRPVAARPALLETARAFRIAIDALPVGKDIRTRLLTHIDAHIAAIEALGA